MTLLCYPVSLEVRPWWHDHRVGGRTVLPAVEALLILAAEAVARFPDVDIRSMRDAVFARFLEIPAGATGLEVIVELAPQADGVLRAGLFSRRRLRSMSRVFEHVRVFFPLSAQRRKNYRAGRAPAERRAEKYLDACEVYRKIIPFGPAWQSLRGRLSLSGRQVRATVQAPERDERPLSGLSGSPFPLDGAMHAACVLGRGLVDYTPFPVGFAARNILQPTESGERYDVMVAQRAPDTDRLLFDLLLSDETGRVCEEVTGLIMRKV